MITRPIGSFGQSTNEHFSSSISKASRLHSAKSRLVEPDGVRWKIGTKAGAKSRRNLSMVNVLFSFLLTQLLVLKARLGGYHGESLDLLYFLSSFLSYSRIISPW